MIFPEELITCTEMISGDLGMNQEHHYYKKLEHFSKVLQNFGMTCCFVWVAKFYFPLYKKMSSEIMFVLLED